MPQLDLQPNAVAFPILVSPESMVARPVKIFRRHHTDSSPAKRHRVQPLPPELRRLFHACMFLILGTFEMIIAMCLLLIIGGAKADEKLRFRYTVNQTCSWIPETDQEIWSHGSGSEIIWDHRSESSVLSRDPLGSWIRPFILSGDPLGS